MSENENGTPPPSDTQEAATTIGHPVPAQSVEEADSHVAVEASEEQSLVIEAKPESAEAKVEPAEAKVEPAEAEPAVTQTDESRDDKVASADEGDDETHRSLMWPVDPEHKNAIGVLSETLDGVKVVEEVARKRPSRALNLMLLVICIGISVAGAQQLASYASADREARETELAVCKFNRGNLEQTMANYHIESLRSLNTSDDKIAQSIQSEYLVDAGRADEIYETFRGLKAKQANSFFGLAGVISLASEPKHAKIYKRRVGEKDFKPVMTKKNGKDVVAYTPYNLQIEDITESYEFELRFTDELKRFKELTDEEKKLLKEGEKPPVETLPVKYRAERFTVSRYQWVKDGGSGDFGMNKLVKMVPDYVQGYLSYDWSKGESKEFETLDECVEFQKANNASICRGLPRLEDFEKADARKEEEEKKNKRGRRRGRRRR